MKDHKTPLSRESEGIPLSTNLPVILFILFILSSFSPVLHAAEPRLEINPLEATVGDPITVTLVVPGASPGEVKWPPVAGKLGDFLVLTTDTAEAAIAEESGGAILTWTVAAYDTGKFSTGTLEILVADKSILIPGGEVQINSVLTDSTASELRPLKAQVNLPYTFMDFVNMAWRWALGLAIAAGLFFLLRWWMRKRKREAEGWKYEKPKLPPYDEALVALRRLKKDNPLKRGDIKGYVSALSEILKRLLERVHEEPVLEMTTWEVRCWTADNKIRADLNEFLRLLSDADMVKFAKVTLEPSRCDDMFRTAEEFVAAYKPAPATPAESALPESVVHAESGMKTREDSPS